MPVEGEKLGLSLHSLHKELSIKIFYPPFPLTFFLPSKSNTAATPRLSVAKKMVHLRRERCVVVVVVVTASDSQSSMCGKKERRKGRIGEGRERGRRGWGRGRT